MVILLVFVGLFVIIFGMLVTSFWKSPANDQQQAYVLRGLVLVIFAIGAFIVGNGIIEALFANTLDTNYATLGGWMIAVPIILVFLFLSDRRKPIQARYRTESAGIVSQVTKINKEDL